jgi:tRNA(fMet)-specific endonuclease VapC
MKKYLLDTSICVHLFRKRLEIEKKLSKIDMSQCFISEITVAELKYGAYKSAKPKENLELINKFVSSINIIPITESIDFFAQEKNRLRTIGKPIEDFDLLIASAAHARNLILVTDNVKHFININDIVIENWVNR